MNVCVKFDGNLTFAEVFQSGRVLEQLTDTAIHSAMPFANVRRNFIIHNV